MYYIGIDLGTSSVKGLLTDAAGNILREESEAYAVAYPQDGWSEQAPEDWLSGTKRVLAKLSAGLENEVAGVSFGGQMHGLVLLDDEDRVIRPAILWNDGRTQRETDLINESFGRERLSALTANVAFAGFTAPKILWVREHEPENFARIAKLMLPKDYLAYMLTGVHSTDYSDASGTLLLDVKNKRWSDEMCRFCGVRPEWLPRLFESFEATGRVRAGYGLPNAVVTAGAGDNAAAAVGTGTVGNGDCNVSLGTSGTVFIAGDTFRVDGNNALHAFAHATGRWHLMGCILSAASCNKWWLEEILRTEDYELARGAEGALGENPVYFLPYLMGERSPHNDTSARGAFLGMRPDTTREEMCLAVLEGVAFALRDCLDVARKNGLTVTRTSVCGGGARSALWRKILANVLDAEVTVPETEQGPAYGAAMLAMVGCGAYATVEEAAGHIVRIKDRVRPDAALVKRYDRTHAVFASCYPALRDVFRKM